MQCGDGLNTLLQLLQAWLHALYLQQADSTAQLTTHLLLSSANTLKRQVPTVATSQVLPALSHPEALQAISTAVSTLLRVCFDLLSEVLSPTGKGGCGWGNQGSVASGEGQEAIAELISQSEAHPPPAYSPAAITWEAIHTCPASR